MIYHNLTWDPDFQVKLQPYLYQNISIYCEIKYLLGINFVILDNILKTKKCTTSIDFFYCRISFANNFQKI